MVNQYYIDSMVNISKLMKQQIILPVMWNAFNFFRCTNNGECVILSTNLNYIPQYFEGKLYNKSVCHRFVNKLSDGIILHSWFKKDIHHHYSQQKFAFKDGLTVIVKHNDFTDHYHFCSNKYDVTMNNETIDYLYSFVDSFCINYQNIIEQAMCYKSHIILDETTNYHYDKLTKTQRFMKFINTGRFYIGDSLYLTKKEVAVSIMLADGYEVSDIAIAMSITRDTINTHIANLKSKLNVTNQGGIIVCAYEYEMKLLSSCMEYVSESRKQKINAK